MDKRIRELAARIDKVARELDPYDYRDTDASMDTALEGLRSDPIGVVEYLVGLLEDMA